ncbi:MAG: 50S ribosomal protein L25 [Phycisphaeraceae bacterium]|nr:50S ribosomal protein L25 [Phycisphaeraceae bacterium]
MHENAPILSAKKRERVGSRYTRRVRESGGLPAVVYGHKQDPMSITIDRRDALTHIDKGERVFQIAIESGAPQLVLLKAVQFDHLGTHMIHADFARVDLNERVRTRVHVVCIGDAKGLGSAGAVMMHPTTEIEIECTIADLPEHIEVDVAALEAGDMITAAEVKLPDGMRLTSDSHAVVAQIKVQAETPTEAEEAVVAGSAQPEVITEKKKEDEAEAPKKK